MASYSLFVLVPPPRSFHLVRLLCSAVCSVMVGVSGVIAVLDEEVFIPRGSDKGFVTKLVKAQEKHPSFLLSR